MGAAQTPANRDAATAASGTKLERCIVVMLSFLTRHLSNEMIQRYHNGVRVEFIRSRYVEKMQSSVWVHTQRHVESQSSWEKRKYENTYALFHHQCDLFVTLLSRTVPTFPVSGRMHYGSLLVDHRSGMRAKKVILDIHHGRNQAPITELSIEGSFISSK